MNKSKTRKNIHPQDPIFFGYHLIPSQSEAGAAVFAGQRHELILESTVGVEDFERPKIQDEADHIEKK